MLALPPVVALRIPLCFLRRSSEVFECVLDDSIFTLQNSVFVVCRTAHEFIFAPFVRMMDRRMHDCEQCPVCETASLTG